LFTGIEQCFEPSTVELALVMQKFHLLRKGVEEETLDDTSKEEWKHVLQRRENAIQVGKKLDYRNVYPHIVEQLEAVLKSWQETGTALYKVKTND
jgi:hypothetical protein